ncbi:MAG: radical SAM family heme chaperone HemW [Flavobacteriales bacterium]|nr:radical SAM family heme chaperone HemW [Flavobacteriales bacterium]
MASIYIHIPFCKQACHYCDFHFSTSANYQSDMVLALAKELELRKQELVNENVTTIYFGGGTPSVLDIEQIQVLIDSVYENYKVSKQPEITLEANPDDLSEAKIKALANTPINRLSIGVQSFFDEDLQLMNRAHNSGEAQKCLQLAKEYFENITVDLIYGVPGMSVERWEENINRVLSLDIPHVSCYALTVEEKTALASFVNNGKIPAPDEQLALLHFEVLVERLTQRGFVHYELSNFGKEGYFSENNTNYWKGEKYIGIGPSAHSFDGQCRSWNVSNNQKYLKELSNNELPSEKEVLSIEDRYNEYVMTGLRTQWGVSLGKIEQKFGKEYLAYFTRQLQKHLDQKTLELIDDDQVKATQKGKFLTDGISSDLFKVN